MYKCPGTDIHTVVIDEAAVVDPQGKGAIFLRAGETVESLFRPTAVERSLKANEAFI